jgi:hypothetical protein
VEYGKCNKATVDEIVGALAVATRVKRPELVAHFMPTTRSLSAFAKQEPVTRAELHHLAKCQSEGHMTAQADATLTKAYVVDTGDLGREPKFGERDWKSTGQSILLYIKDRIATVAADHGVIVADTFGTDVSVTIIDG